MDLSALQNLTTRQLTTFDLDRKSKTISVPRGQRVSLTEVVGHGTITQLWLTFPGWFWQHWAPAAPISQTILKTLILRIYWDGESKPAVEAPVGDFFGNGLCEVRSFTSRYFGMSSGGFYMKFPMPFRKGFRVEFENLDEVVDVDVFANILYQTGPEPPEGVGYFHAQFHTARNDGTQPMDILEAEGRGHLVGCVVSAQAPEKNYLSFLEAPEYISVDEDWDPPRIVGTGLEDYFLGGWYFREGEFAGELHGVPSKDAMNSSIAMYRVHEADAVHFSRRIRFQFVNPWDPERLKPFTYSSVAFHYLDRAVGWGGRLGDRSDLLCWPRIRDCDHISIP
ncbi:hypothetical protein BH09VER1_BH09VER1_39830 [soil metagenome]